MTSLPTGPGSPRPLVATVLSARPWEARLVAAARASGAIRLVGRLYEPSDLDRLPPVDVVVVGAETSWATPALLSGWQRNGLRVLGVAPSGDRPARDRFRAAGAGIVAEQAPIEEMICAIRRLTAHPAPVTGRGRVVAVVGSRGAPGRTEVALALAWGLGRSLSTLLVDLDLSAPSLGIRLGIPPNGGLAVAAEWVRRYGSIDTDSVPRVGPLDIVTAEAGARPDPASELMLAARNDYPVTVVDLGPDECDGPLLSDSDAAVLVCEPTALGLIRTSRLIERWDGPLPWLVLNRVVERDEAVAAARKWIGLEPAVVLGEDAAIRTLRTGAAPQRWMVGALTSLRQVLLAPEFQSEPAAR
jgi:hypothetical protein